MEQIDLEIDQTGTVIIRVSGIKGGRCKDVTALIEKNLGKVTADSPTDEMNEEPVKQYDTTKA